MNQTGDHPKTLALQQLQYIPTDKENELNLSFEQQSLKDSGKRVKRNRYNHQYQTSEYSWKIVIGIIVGILIGFTISNFYANWVHMKAIVKIHLEQKHDVSQINKSLADKPLSDKDKSIYKFQEMEVNQDQKIRQKRNEKKHINRKKQKIEVDSDVGLKNEKKGQKNKKQKFKVKRKVNSKIQDSFQQTQFLKDSNKQNKINEIDESEEEIKTMVKQVFKKNLAQTNHQKQQITSQEKTEVKQEETLIQKSNISVNKQQVHDLSDKKQTNFVPPQQKNIEQLKPTQNLPKIFWLLTNSEFEGLETLDFTIANHLRAVAEESGFEFRAVSTWSAYNYLSPEMTQRITKTMHNSKTENTVFDLLRLALLIEHGGVSLVLYETLLTENLDWLINIFSGQPSETDRARFRCSATILPEVFIESYKQMPYGTKYDKFFIAAMPQSILLKETFESLTEMMVKGEWRYKGIDKKVQIKSDHHSMTLDNILINTISGILYTGSDSNENVCKRYNFQSISISQDAQKFLEYDRTPITYLTDHNKNQDLFSMHMVHKVNRNSLKQYLMLILQKDSLEQAGISPESFLPTVLQSKGNEMYKQPELSTERQNIQICIVSARPVTDLNDLEASMASLNQQTFSQWIAVYYLKTVDQKVYQDPKFKILQHKNRGEGLNTQDAIVNQCPNKSIILLLQFNERLKKNNYLDMIAFKMKQQNIFGLFLPLDVNGEKIIPLNDYTGFNRVKGWGQGVNYTPQSLAQIVNHFRVFHSDYYKLIPHFQLHNVEGQYFSRVLYQMQILQMCRINVFPREIAFETKRYKNFIDLCESSQILEKVEIQTNVWRTAEIEQMEETKDKLASDSLVQTIQNFVKRGIDLKELLVFNSGQDYVPPSSRKTPKIIPKILHRIWIRGQLPPFKKYLYQQTKKILPDFSNRLWTQKDITKQNFPYTYQMIKNLIQFQEQSPYSKMAQISDLMRYEIIYNHGGYYLDVNLQIFKNNLEDWLTYKFVIPQEKTLSHRWRLNMCFFGAMPKYPPFLRLITHNNTNRYNIYDPFIATQTGSENFRRAFIGNQQLDPDILTMPFESFKPTAWWQSPRKDPCVLQQNEVDASNSEQVLQDQGVLNRQLGFIKDCGKYSPYAYGSKHSQFGMSWQDSRW